MDYKPVLEDQYQCLLKSCERYGVTLDVEERNARLREAFRKFVSSHSPTRYANADSSYTPYRCSDAAVAEAKAALAADEADERIP